MEDETRMQVDEDEGRIVPDSHHEEMKYRTRNINNPKDVSQLILLLQSQGFVLEPYEKLEGPYRDEDVVVVEVTCMKLHMKATLNKTFTTCSYSTNDDGNNAYIGTANGTHDRHALNGMNLPSTSSIKQILTNHPAWTDIITSPPKMTSSPLPEANGFNNFANEGRLADMLKGIIKMGQEAYEVVAGKNPQPARSGQKRISAIKVSPLVMQEMPIGGSFISMNTTHTRNSPSIRQTPKRPVTPKNVVLTPGNKKKVLPPTKLNVFKNKFLTTRDKSPSGVQKRTPLKDTPRPTLQKKNAAREVLTPSRENVPVGLSRMKSGSKIPGFGLVKRN